MSWSDVCRIAQKCATKKVLNNREHLVFYTFAFGVKYPERRNEALKELNEALGL